jgi:hypothetical protein
MYWRGYGVPQDFEQALRWFRPAAERGESVAMWNLGAMYANGEGVARDYIRAHSWLNLAAARMPPGETRTGALTLGQPRCAHDARADRRGAAARAGVGRCASGCPMNPVCASPTLSRRCDPLDALRDHAPCIAVTRPAFFAHVPNPDHLATAGDISGNLL